MRSALPRSLSSSGSREQDEAGVVARDFQEVRMEFEPRDLEAGRARLAGAEKLAFAAQL